MRCNHCGSKYIPNEAVTREGYDHTCLICGACLDRRHPSLEEKIHAQKWTRTKLLELTPEQLFSDTCAHLAEKFQTSRHRIDEARRAAGGYQRVGSFSRSLFKGDHHDL